MIVGLPQGACLVYHFSFAFSFSLSLSPKLNLYISSISQVSLFTVCWCVCTHSSTAFIGTPRDNVFFLFLVGKFRIPKTCKYNACGWCQVDCAYSVHTLSIQPQRKRWYNSKSKQALRLTDCAHINCVTI